MSQPVYDPTIFYRFLEQAPDITGIPVLLGVMPLVSYRQALYLHNEVPGIDIPYRVLEKLAGSSEAAQLGMELALDLINQLGSLVSGVYLVPSYNRVDNLVPLIEYIRRAFDSDSAMNP
jgi:homocysteine S-methyltransferase